MWLRVVVMSVAQETTGGAVCPLCHAITPHGQIHYCPKAVNAGEPLYPFTPGPLPVFRFMPDSPQVCITKQAERLSVRAKQVANLRRSLKQLQRAYNAVVGQRDSFIHRSIALNDACNAHGEKEARLTRERDEARAEAERFKQLDAMWQRKSELL